MTKKPTPFGAKLSTPFLALPDEYIETLLRKEQTPHPAVERVREVAKKYWKM